MMKTQSRPEASLGTLAGLPYEAVKWELLRTAITLGVFDCLSTSKIARDVAFALGTHPANTAHLLNALVALGCLNKLNGAFVNTPLAETFLTGDKETSLGESLLFMEKWIFPILNGGMLGLVRNGPSRSESVGSEAIWEAGARASLNHCRCGRAQRIASYVASPPEFPSFTRILDLGAGCGIMGIAITVAHLPSLAVDMVADEPMVFRLQSTDAGAVEGSHSGRPYPVFDDPDDKAVYITVGEWYGGHSPDVSVPTRPAQDGIIDWSMFSDPNQNLEEIEALAYDGQGEPLYVYGDLSAEEFVLIADETSVPEGQEKVYYEAEVNSGTLNVSNTGMPEGYSTDRQHVVLNEFTLASVDLVHTVNGTTYLPTLVLETDLQ